MAEPTHFELLELATPYALDAVSDAERVDIDRRVAAAPSAIASAFGNEVRAVRETMALVSTTTVADPPAPLLTAILAVIEPTQPETGYRFRWRTAVSDPAAAVAAGLEAFSARLRPRRPRWILSRERNAELPRR
jgi:hypothetical protein